MMMMMRFLFSLFTATLLSALATSAVFSQSPTLPPNGEMTNPCPEGQFLDLYDNVCHSLDQPQLGFQIDAFQRDFSGHVVESGCTAEAFQVALSQAAGGGIVQIPACTFDIGRIEIPSNIIIQGAGAGQTVLTANTQGGDIKLNVQDAANVVLRDMTLDSGDADYVMLNIERTDNILLERLEVKGSRIMGIKFWNGVRNITIRYSESHHHSVNHGIGSKDCSTGVDISKCPVERWSRAYSIYSNYLHHNGTHGINLHAINGEVAGNLSEQNKYGGKFFDAQNVWVHHNTFRNNAQWGLYMAPTLRIAERTSRNLYFYYNRFLNTGNMAWGITPGGAEVKQSAADYADIYLIDNVYVGGKIDSQNVALDICPHTNEVDLAVPHAQMGADEVCKLDNYPSLANSVKPMQADAATAHPESAAAIDVASSDPGNAPTENAVAPIPTVNQAANQFVASASASEEPNVAANVVDGELDTRWSAEGDGQWVQLDLGAPHLIDGVEVAWFLGAERTAHFDLLTSVDGERWITAVAEQESSGQTDELETYPLDDLLLAARYVRIVGHGNSEQGPDGWNSIAEINVTAGQPAAPSSSRSGLCSANRPSALDAGVYCFCIAAQGVGVCN
ncbi:MAG: discoidin domain-containing protein [Caldilineaceae bacterium]